MSGIVRGVVNVARMGRTKICEESFRRKGLRRKNIRKTYVRRGPDSLCSKYEAEFSSSINTVMNNCISYILGRFLSIWADVSCVKWAMTHAVIWGQSYSKVFV